MWDSLQDLEALDAYRKISTCALCINFPDDRWRYWTWISSPCTCIKSYFIFQMDISCLKKKKKKPAKYLGLVAHLPKPCWFPKYPSKCYYKTMHGWLTQTLNAIETSTLLTNLVWFATDLQYILANMVHKHTIIGSESAREAYWKINTSPIQV